MHLDTEAILLTALPHGENGAVVRFLTAERGLVAGYVAGARSRRLRPALAAGNIVRLRLDSRSEGQLARAVVELERSRALLVLDANALAVAEWLTGLVATVMPEGHPYPRLHATLGSVLDIVEHADTVLDRLAALARFEVLLLAELGFGLDLSRCAATGQTHDLAFVSPRTGRAVSASAGQPHAARLFRLSPLLRGEAGDDADVAEALRTTRHFIARDLLGGRRDMLLGARDRAVQGAGPPVAGDGERRPGEGN